MFIKVTDAATGKPVMLNSGSVAEFKYSDTPNGGTFAFFIGGHCSHIKESLPEIEGALHYAGQFEALPPPVDIDHTRKQLAEAIAAKAQADADEAARLRGEWPKSRA